MQSQHQLHDAADISSRHLLRPAADDDFFHMSKRMCGQVLMLPSRRLVIPAADDNFVILLYSLQNCYAFEEKVFILPPSSHEKVILSYLKMNLKISHKLR